MSKFIQPFVCPDCEDFIEGQTKEEHRKKCKGKPSVVESDPPAPVKDSVKKEEKQSSGSLYGDTVENRNRRAREWRERNREAHREYMREYMRRKRKESR